MLFKQRKIYRVLLNDGVARITQIDKRVVFFVNEPPPPPLPPPPLPHPSSTPPGAGEAGRRAVCVCARVCALSPGAVECVSVEVLCLACS